MVVSLDISRTPEREYSHREGIFYADLFLEPTGAQCYVRSILPFGDNCKHELVVFYFIARGTAWKLRAVSCAR